MNADEYRGITVKSVVYMLVIIKCTVFVNIQNFPTNLKIHKPGKTFFVIKYFIS